MNEYSHGLTVDGVLIGDIAPDGGLTTTFVNPGKVLEDSIEMNPAETTQTPFVAQGDTNPFLIIKKKGLKNGQFILATMDKEVIADLTGGSLEGTGENVVFSEPEGIVVVEKSLRLIDEEGTFWTMPRVDIDANLVGRFRLNELNHLLVKFTQMQPKKAGVKAFSLGNPVAP